MKYILNSLASIIAIWLVLTAVDINMPITDMMIFMSASFCVSIIGYIYEDKITSIPTFHSALYSAICKMSGEIGFMSLCVILVATISRHEQILNALISQTGGQ